MKGMRYVVAWSVLVIMGGCTQAFDVEDQMVTERAVESHGVSSQDEGRVALNAAQVEHLKEQVELHGAQGDERGGGAVIDASYALAAHYTSTGHVGEARLWRERTVQEFHGLGLASGTLAASKTAQVQFELLEERFATIKTTYGEVMLDTDKEVREMLSTLTREMNPIVQGYAQIEQFGDPQWMTAALYELGMCHTFLIDAIRRHVAGVDAGLTPAQVPIYLAIVDDHVRPIEEKALSYFEESVQVAEALGMENAWTEQARTRRDHWRRLLHDQH